VSAQVQQGTNIVACTYVQGGVSGLLQRTHEWTVPGVAGTFALNLGQNMSQFMFRVVLYDTLANVQTWKTNLEAFIGKIVTITDDQGTAWGNLVLKDVQPGSDNRWRSACIGPSGVNTRGELKLVGFVVN